VPPLVDHLQFNEPPVEFSTEIGPTSPALARFLWNGLASNTRKMYGSHQRSYEYFCATHSQTPFPATCHTLGEWITGRGIGSATPYQGILLPDSCQNALSAIRSIHVDRGFSTEVFKSEWLARIMKGIRRVQPHHEKTQAAPLTIDILEKLVGHPSPTPLLPIQKMTASSINDLNVTVASKVAYAGFLQGGEMFYDSKDLANRSVFSNTKLSRSDITFGINDEHVVLTLKRSKTDTLHEGVDIILAATGTATCPVLALRQLWIQDPQPRGAPLFRLANRAFSSDAVMTIIRARLRTHGIQNYASFTGHSFRRGAAQTASDIGLPESDIQALGRWTSDAFRLYFVTQMPQRFRLSMRFLAGRSPSFSS